MFWDGVRNYTGENMQNFLGKHNEQLPKSEWKAGGVTKTPKPIRGKD
jgi:hypothetical protein